MYVCTEETKAVKRSYQKIQEDEDDEDDDYRNYTSPRNTGSSAAQLVGVQEVCPEISVLMPHLSLAALFCPHIPAAMSASLQSELMSSTSTLSDPSVLSDRGAGEGAARPGERCLR